jgi:hypothetical protein
MGCIFHAQGTSKAEIYQILYQRIENQKSVITDCMKPKFTDSTLNSPKTVTVIDDIDMVQSDD